MKTIVTMTVTLEVVESFKKRAQDLGVSASVFAEVAIKVLLGMAPEELSDALASLAPVRADRTNFRGLNRRETALIRAFKPLEEKLGGAWRFPIEDLSKEAGLYPSEAIGALRSLERRGLIEVLRWPDPNGRLNSDGGQLVYDVWNLPRPPQPKTSAP